MRAAVTTAAGQISVEAVRDPDPGPDDAVVDVRAIGLCGTDLHMFLGERHETRCARATRSVAPWPRSRRDTPGRSRWAAP